MSELFFTKEACDVSFSSKNYLMNSHYVLCFVSETFQHFCCIRLRSYQFTSWVSVFIANKVIMSSFDLQDF